jgi:CubicO group peptidase (beta-lactamase class C family)
LPASERLTVDLARLLRTHQGERRIPSISAAAFRGGELLWQDAIGQAGIESGAAATPDTQYRVGSITKTFTAVAILQLRDAGELRLEDTLGDHIAESAHRGPTLRSMLAHVSGLQREPPGEIWESLEDPEVEELIARLPDAEMILPPGAYWHYSNLAYALLGEIVARRAGRPATEYLDEHVIGPLELTRTTWRPAAPAADGYLVNPYTETAQLEKPVELKGSAPIGQLWSTSGDLARYGAFLAEGDEAVLAQRTLEEMHAFQAMVPYVKNWTLGWGLGLELYRDGDRIYAGHGGAMPGFQAALLVSREDGTGAVALANGSALTYVDTLALRLAGKAFELAPPAPEEWQVEEAPPAEIAELLGRWWGEGVEYVFRWRKGQLEASLAAESPRMLEATRFEHEAPGRFRTISGLERGELLRVERDDDGRVEKLYWATYPFTRAPRTFGT